MTCCWIQINVEELQIGLPKIATHHLQMAWMQSQGLACVQRGSFFYHAAAVVTKSHSECFSFKVRRKPCGLREARMWSQMKGGQLRVNFEARRPRCQLRSPAKRVEELRPLAKGREAPLQPQRSQLGFCVTVRLLRHPLLLVIVRRRWGLRARKSLLGRTLIEHKSMQGSTKPFSFPSWAHSQWQRRKTTRFWNFYTLAFSIIIRQKPKESYRWF